MTHAFHFKAFHCLSRACRNAARRRSVIFNTITDQFSDAFRKIEFHLSFFLPKILCCFSVPGDISCTIVIAESVCVCFWHARIPLASSLGRHLRNQTCIECSKIVICLQRLCIPFAKSQRNCFAPTEKRKHKLRSRLSSAAECHRMRWNSKAIKCKIDRMYRRHRQLHELILLCEFLI